MIALIISIALTVLWILLFVFDLKGHHKTREQVEACYRSMRRLEGVWREHLEHSDELATHMHDIEKTYLGLPEHKRFHSKLKPNRVVTFNDGTDSPRPKED